MNKWGTRVLRLTSTLAMAALVLALPACGGGGGGGGGTPPGVTPTFTTNNGSSATDLVRFSGADCSTGDTCVVTVSIGDTTESDYYAFAFDIMIDDPTVAQFVAGSDEAGPFLSGGSADSIVSQNGDRVVVGVSKTGQVAGNGTASEATVLTLTFQVLKVGSATLTFAGSPSNPALANCSSNDAEAINDQGNCTVNTVFGTGGVISGS